MDGTFGVALFEKVKLFLVQSEALWLNYMHNITYLIFILWMSSYGLNKFKNGKKAQNMIFPFYI